MDCPPPARRRQFLHSLACLGFLAALVSHPGQAGTIRQLTDFRATRFGAYAIDDAGTSAFVISSTNQLGTNPGHLFQIFRFDAATGLGQQLTSFPKGVSSLADTLSVSDDGQWLAFVSRSDLTGQNHDASPEVFVMHPDGTGLAQRTSDPAVNAGAVSAVTLSGSANRIAFLSNSNPLGTNASGRVQLFVVNFDGTGLKQLTTVPTTPTAYWYGIGISDDGQRIVFASTANLTGANLDRSAEIFAIQADGTGLRQLTTTTGYGAESPSLSGNGNKIAFELNDSSGNLSLSVINWDGTGQALLRPPEASYPSITDDGQFIFFGYNDEIWKIKSDGTGLTEITFSSPTPRDQPVVAGAGGRVVYKARPTAYLHWEEPHELDVMSAAGTNNLTLGVAQLADSGDAEITRDGTRIVFASNADFLGTNPDHGSEIYRMEADGSGLFQITHLASGDAEEPSIAADRSTIVFLSDADPLGQNSDLSYEFFRIQADGTGLQQLTTNLGDLYRPEISPNGAIIAFALNLNLFRIDANGGGLVPLAPVYGSYGQRLDQVGNWVAFHSYGNVDGTNTGGNPQIYRITSDGTGLQRITLDNARAALYPDISALGARIAYFSNANPFGTNPSGFFQEFVYETATGVTRQLTTGTSNSYGPGLSGDGTYVYFSSYSRFAEPNPNPYLNLYRVPAAGGAVERVGGLPGGAPDYPYAPRPDTTGSRVVFNTSNADATEQNPDLSSEIWLINMNEDPRIHVSKAAPTVLTWDHEAGALRYDVIRGNVASLGPGALGTVSLGPVVCLENDSPDTDTNGFGDVAQPAVGQAFFYMFRGSRGLNYGPGSWGQDSAGHERVPASGACAP